MHLGSGERRALAAAGGEGKATSQPRVLPLDTASPNPLRHAGTGSTQPCVGSSRTARCQEHLKERKKKKTMLSSDDSVLQRKLKKENKKPQPAKHLGAEEVVETGGQEAVRGWCQQCRCSGAAGWPAAGSSAWCGERFSGVSSATSDVAERNVARHQQPFSWLR